MLLFYYMDSDLSGYNSKSNKSEELLSQLKYIKIVKCCSLFRIIRL